MSYSGYPAGSNGVWNGNIPPNANANASASSSPYGRNDGRTQSALNGNYYTPSSNGQNQYSTPQQYIPQRNVSSPGFNNGYRPPQHRQAQPQAVTSQFIDPTQLFQQPQPQRAYQKTQHISQMGQRVSSQANTPQYPAPTRPATIDPAMLLMSLAEDYFEAAHALASSVSLSMAPAHLDEYHKLIAMGLGALDTTLKNIPKLEPRVEANIRLRYAGVLYEETENSMEAETALSKGIALCERVCLTR